MRVLAIASLALISCGGSVSPEAETVPDSGVISTTETGGASGGATPGAVDGGSSGAGSTCSRTSDRVDITVVGGGYKVDCSGSAFPLEPLSFTGQVVATDASSISVDQCHPAADCVPRVAVITARAPGLDLTRIKKNTFVHVDFEMYRSWACTSRLIVKAVDEWGGMKNPVEGARVLLAASDGRFGSVPPFFVNRVATGCFKPKYEGCGSPSKPDWYNLTFSEGEHGTPTTIAMGQTAKFVAGGQTFTARNLRSFYEGLCDAYWDWAWWATSFE